MAIHFGADPDHNGAGSCATENSAPSVSRGRIDKVRQVRNFVSKLETIRAVRFGYGQGPGVAPPNASAMIGALGARDSMVRRYPTPSTRAALKMMTDLRDSRRAIDSGASNAQTQYEAAQKALRDAFGQTFRASMARVVDSPAPFRERLAWFWADHFTATAKTGVLRGPTEAIWTKPSARIWAVALPTCSRLSSPTLSCLPTSTRSPRSVRTRGLANAAAKG